MTPNGLHYILIFMRSITTKLDWVLACKINPIITQGLPFSNFIFYACKKWIARVKKIDEWVKLFMASNRWFTFEIWRLVSDLFLVKQKLFVNILIRRRYFENLDDSLTNIWLVLCFLNKFRLNWKNFFGEAILFLKHFYFCVNFINFRKISVWTELS